MTVIDREYTAIEQAIAETIVADPPEVPVAPGEIDPRVLDGVAFLDEHHPGWANRINLKRLDLGSPSSCVLGQLWGDYEEAVVVLWGDRFASDALVWQGDGEDVPPRRYGFLARRDEIDGYGYAAYAVLQESWERVIRERQCRH